MRRASARGPKSPRLTRNVSIQVRSSCARSHPHPTVPPLWGEHMHFANKKRNCCGGIEIIPRREFPGRGFGAESCVAADGRAAGLIVAEGDRDRHYRRAVERDCSAMYSFLKLLIRYSDHPSLLTGCRSTSQPSRRRKAPPTRNNLIHRSAAVPQIRPSFCAKTRFLRSAAWAWKPG